MIRFLLSLLIILGLPAMTWAQSNAVIIVPFGPTQKLPTRDLDANQKVISLGAHRVVPLGEDVQISDIKILPDGSHLLANVSGRGFAISDKNGNYRYEFDKQKRVPSIRTASVANYFSPGEPSTIAVADSASQFAFLKDLSSDQIIWVQNLREENTPGDIVEILVQPENKITLAINYPSLNLSFIETFIVSQPPQASFRLANRAHATQPENTVLLPELKNIREVMVLANGSYLITSALHLMNVSKIGEPIWKISIGDLPKLGGEFSSARMLPTGLIAISTYQPGAWTQPHTYHRVHWFDPNTQLIVASSDVFSSAPIRVEPLGGHGGTGSFGFEAGLNDIGKGDAKKIELTQLNVSPTKIAVGDRIAHSFSLKNNDLFLVGLKSAKLWANPESCQALQALQALAEGRVLLNQATNLTINPTGIFRLAKESIISSTFKSGNWCINVELIDLFDQSFFLEKTIEFSIREKSSQSTSTTQVSELPFHEGIADVENDGSSENSNIRFIDEGGCCSSVSKKHPTLIFIFPILGLLFWRRKSLS